MTLGWHVPALYNGTVSLPGHLCAVSSPGSHSIIHPPHQVLPTAIKIWALSSNCLQKSKGNETQGSESRGPWRSEGGRGTDGVCPGVGTTCSGKSGEAHVKGKSVCACQPGSSAVRDSADTAWLLVTTQDSVSKGSEFCG